MGVVGMCKEHLGVALALKVPVFFVVTKVDIAPEHVLKNTVQVTTWGSRAWNAVVWEGCVRHILVRIASWEQICGVKISS
jgi:hypothetical protein